MGRRIPTSGKARKEQLQTKRAVKKDRAVPTLHPLDEQAASTPRTLAPEFDAGALQVGSSRPSGAQRFRTADEANRDASKEGRMKLESRFLRLPLDLLNHHRLVCATEVLDRPVPDELGVLTVDELQPAELEGLTCPRRPKWRYTMSKLEVERNEEGVYAKWLASTDSTLTTFTSRPDAKGLSRSPSFFERNLNVWRQLWRVTETSSIILILIDSRFPLIHFPPSLEAYVKGLGKPYILVLTKTDLVPRWLAEAWQGWFLERAKEQSDSNFIDCVLMTSYREVENTALTQGTKPRYMPAAPTSARAALLSAFRRAHEQLLSPPEGVTRAREGDDDQKRAQRIARWSPRVRRAVDWDSVEDEKTVTAQLKAQEAAKHAEELAKRKDKAVEKKKTRRKQDKDVFVLKPTFHQQKEIDAREAAGKAAAKADHEAEEEEQNGDQEGEYNPLKGKNPLEGMTGDDAHPFITIGLIGQPNVGKSSLLNALLGKKVVRASRTPGKTKTLQTIFWNRTIRLCDCPGLVVPSAAGMERQVLSGIIPIQNVEPVLYYISQRLPFETPLKLKQDEDEFDLQQDQPKWTADELLTAYAVQQNFITAKAGRPDLYRAGAQILRSLHTSSLPWGFRPPFRGDVSNQGQQEGIWIKDFVAQASTEEELRRDARRAGSDSDYSGSETDGEGHGEEEEESEEESEDGTEEEELAVANRGAVAAVKSAFAGLMVEGGDDDDEEEDDEDESE